MSTILAHELLNTLSFHLNSGVLRQKSKKQWQTFNVARKRLNSWMNASDICEPPSELIILETRFWATERTAWLLCVRQCSSIL